MATTPAINPLELSVNLPQRLLDLLFPPRCVHCGLTGSPLCAACRSAIRQPPAPRCARCDQPLSAATGRQCASCDALARLPAPPALERIVVASVYEGAVGSAIRALKFRKQRRLAQPLGRLLADAAVRAGLSGDLIIPMPLHRGRRRERGYNQATLLARPLASALRAPLYDGALARIRATRPQTRLSRDARRANVAGAFALTGGPVAVSLLAGKRILLVDDVTTTGATLDAAAEALLAARPAAIYALAVARPMRSGAMPDDDVALDL
ncbi:MAG TPA: ComF family protein [Ktedonobacterales bacterium]